MCCANDFGRIRQIFAQHGDADPCAGAELLSFKLKLPGLDGRKQLATFLLCVLPAGHVHHQREVGAGQARHGVPRSGEVLQHPSEIEHQVIARLVPVGVTHGAMVVEGDI